MFSSLKNKLLVMQEGIVSSLSRDETSIWTHKREFLAGAHLLAKYQYDWQGIHALSERNAVEAKAIYQQIEEVNRCIKLHWYAVKKFSSDVGDLNKILSHTEKTLNEIGNIRTLIQEVHLKIVEAEDLIEEERLAKAMSSAENKLSSFHEEKLISIDTLKEKLAENYEIRQKMIEEEKEEMKKMSFQLAERRFLEDISAYKECGMLPKSKKDEGQLVLKIEDVEIEQDLSMLEEYFDE